MNAEVLRQHQAYKAARERIFMAGRSVKHFKPVEPVVIPEPVERPVPKLVWVRQYNDHVIAFRRWQLAEEQGKEYVPMVGRPEAHSIIMEVLAEFPGVTLEDIKGPRRQKRIVQARQIAMYEVCKQRPDMSYPQVGKLFGGKDHTTCMYAVRKLSAERGPIRGKAGQ